MSERYCTVPGKKVDPSECGSFDGCGEPGKCELRKCYGWDKYTPAKAARKTPGPESSERECNMCHRELDIGNFRKKKTGGRKKTCFECEDRYIKKTAPLKWYPKSRPKTDKPAPSEKVKVKPEPIPDKPAEEKPSLDLSGFTKITNDNRKGEPPSVRFHRREIKFNAPFRKQHADIIQKCQTIDIYFRNGNGVQIVFCPRADMFGQYRVQHGIEGKADFKLGVCLSTHGIKVDKGPWPVKEVDGYFLVEIEG